MRLATKIGAATFVAVELTAMTLQARAEDRSQLVSCQALIDRAAQAAKDSGAGSRQDAPELVRCRQIVREWMLRDARMSVDERGQPLR
jgi:hypothetical protein